MLLFNEAIFFVVIYNALDWLMPEIIFFNGLQYASIIFVVPSVIDLRISIKVHMY